MLKYRCLSPPHKNIFHIIVELKKNNIFAMGLMKKIGSKVSRFHTFCKYLTINYRTSMKPNRKSNIKPDLFWLGKNNFIE